VSAEGKPWREHGWLLPYLLLGDEVFGVGRLTWWSNGVFFSETGLPDGPIPQLHFRSARDNHVRDGLPQIPPGGGPSLSPAGARKHIESLVSSMGGSWDAMLYLVHWLHWGLGLARESDGPPESPWAEEWGDMLYRDFQLGRLQAADADVLGDILAERHGGGWNPHAFYPTPIGVCETMVQMTMVDLPGDARDVRLAAVCDPCVGTGRMLLAASNHSLNLHGMDIDRTMVETCAINLALFAPWGVFIPERTAAAMNRPAVCNKEQEEQAVRSIAVHRPEPVRVRSFDRHGQGLLFSAEIDGDGGKTTSKGGEA